MLQTDSDSSHTSNRSHFPEDPRPQLGRDTGMRHVEDIQATGEEITPNPTRHSTADAPTPSLAASDEDIPVRSKHRFAKTSFRLSKKEAYSQIFGPTLDDLYPVLQTKDIWHINPRDAVFPSRASLQEALQLNAKGEYLERKRTNRTL